MLRTARCANAVSLSSNPAQLPALGQPESSENLFRSWRRLRHASAQVVLKCEKVGQSLIDLHKQVGSRSLDIFVPQLDDHLSEAPDRAYRMHRVGFPGWVGIAAHFFRSLPLGNGAPRRISRS